MRLCTDKPLYTIVEKMDCEHSIEYEQSLRSIQLGLINNTHIDLKSYALYISLGAIVLFFEKDVLNTESNSDEKTKSQLSRYDPLFSIKPIQGNCTAVLYHIKNAVCHGHVAINTKEITFNNNTNTGAVVFSMDCADVVDGVYNVICDLKNSFKRLMNWFTICQEIIISAKQGNYPENSGPSPILSFIEFMMLYEKMKVASEIVEHPIWPQNHELDHTLDCILKMDLFEIISMKTMRNTFSHDYDFVDGYFVIKDKQGIILGNIGFWDWLYASDSLRILTYCLIIESMFQSQHY